MNFFSILDDNEGIFDLESFSQLLSNQELKVFLKRCLLDENLANCILNRSYIHQLGFTKYVLHISDKKEIIVRMNVWKNSNMLYSISNDIHDHCYNFTSKVIIGHLTHYIYEENEFGENYDLFMYSFDRKNNKSIQEYERSIKVSLRNRFSVFSGEVYEFNSNIFHKVEFSSPITVTIQVQGRYNKKSARVLKNKIDTQTIESKKGLSALQYKDLEEDFKKIISVM